MKNKYFIFLMILLSFLLIMGFTRSNDTIFYYAYNEKIYINELDNKLIVRYKQNKRSDEKQISLYSDLAAKQIEWNDDSTCIITVSVNEKKLLKGKILKQPDVKSCNSVYSINSGLEMGLTDEFIVRFKENVSQKEIEKLHKKYKVEVVKKTDLYQLIKLPVASDVLEIANKYQESGMTRFSHPNFICEMELHQVIPNDPYFVNQFSLNNTGQVFTDGHFGTDDADIDAPEAWEITRGGSDIIIAVLDQGVTANHPDLPNLRQVRLDGSNFVNGDSNNPSPEGNDNHGNACAGIIGATQNNNEGISGIAPNCKIMPIRVIGASPQETADAIKFAWENGAHVISNSWGYSSNNSNLYPVIRDAIIEATTKGRNNLGCVVVFSASNSANHVNGSDGEVRFPANVDVPGVLTVGASDRDDLQSNYSPTSDPNSSNNQMIDIVAPSHRAYSCQIAGETFEAWSLDIPNNLGYNPVVNTDCGILPEIGEILPNSGINNLSYTGRFGGTSCSCPQVAGVAALILSVNSNLTQQEVFEILTGTADEVGGYNYINGRSNELGFGRLNACGAVSEAVSTALIGGPNLVCTANSTFSLSNLSSVTSVTWTSSSNITFPSGNTGGTVTAKAYSSISSGSGWIEATINGACGDVTLPRKNVWVGVPNNLIGEIWNKEDGEDQTFCKTNYFSAENSVTIRCDGASFNAQYEWDILTDNFGYNTRNNKIDIQPYTEGFIAFRVRVENSCGWSDWASFSYPVIDCDGSGGEMFMMASPNPANEYTELNFYSENELSNYQKKTMVSIPINEESQDLGEYEIQIWHERKGLVKQLKSKSKKLQIPTNNLDEGTYFLHVIVNGKVHKQQLKIQR